MLSSLDASAIFLAEKTEAQKLRADIQKQSHGFIACLVKAATNCEKSSTTIGADCTLATGTAVNGGDAKGKFQGDIAKCEGKLAFLKKAKTLTAVTGYEAIGCPGDSVSGGADDRYTDMNAYQAGTKPSTKSQIDTLAVALGAVSGCGMNADPQKCQAAEVKRVAGYAFAVQKCQLACETDYKNKKGNGGPAPDSATACSLNANANGSTGDTNFEACIAKAYGKLIKTPLPVGEATVVLPALATALNDANNDINNQDDCN
jgi:hypothetical protein